MTGGGVEARGGGDELTGGLHAQEHFATGFVVVAGGGQDVFDVLRSGILQEELEDGLPVLGADRAGTEALEGGAVAFAEPADGGDAGLSGPDVVGEDAGGASQGVFESEQEVALFAGRIGSEQEATAGGVEEGRR